MGEEAPWHHNTFSDKVTQKQFEVFVTGKTEDDYAPFLVIRCEGGRTSDVIVGTSRLIKHWWKGYRVWLGFDNYPSVEEIWTSAGFKGNADPRVYGTLDPKTLLKRLLLNDNLTFTYQPEDEVDGKQTDTILLKGINKAIAPFAQSCGAEVVSIRNRLFVQFPSD